MSLRTRPGDISASKCTVDAVEREVRGRIKYTAVGGKGLGAAVSLFLRTFGLNKASSHARSSQSCDANMMRCEPTRRAAVYVPCTYHHDASALVDARCSLLVCFSQGEDAWLCLCLCMGGLACPSR